MARTGCRLLVLAVCLAAAPWLAQATTDCNWKPECPATGTVKYPIPCPNNCNRYFECRNGKLSTEKCTLTRKFNHQLLTCQWSLAFTGDCDWFLWHDQTQITCPFTPQCPAKGETKVALPCEGQCHQYALCKDGDWKVEKCPWNHHNFDHTTGECKDKEEVDCNWWKPTEKPTEPPTEKPTEPPTQKPTEPPTQIPTQTPTQKPSEKPSQKPTEPPTQIPTQTPTQKPSEKPTQNPTAPPSSPTSPPATSPGPVLTTPSAVTTASPSDPSSDCGKPPKCPQQGHVLLPVPCPDKCQKYYDCQDGKYTEKSCMPWESFDPKKGKCTLFYGVDCSQYGPSTPAPTSKPDKPADKPCDFKPTCPASGSVKIADPCPKRCQWYFQCEQGKAVSKQCLPWENFDPVSLVCTVFWTVDCSWGQHVTPTVPGQTQTPPQTTTPKVTTPPPFIPGCLFRPECPATGSAKLAIPCPKHCEDYVQCNNGKPSIARCGWFQKFDPKSLSCAFFGVDCDWYLKPRPTNPSLLIRKMLHQS